MHRWIFLGLAAVPLALSIVTPATTPEVVWWTTHAVDKVKPYDPEPEQANHDVKLSAARNEFEPFQIILRAQSGDLEGVDIQVSDLTGPNKAVISKDKVSIYLERYLDLKMPSSIEGGTGEWPDPLVPRVDNYFHEKRNAFPVKLVKGRNQPIWIELYVPRSSVPGTYQGHVDVLVSKTLLLSIPVKLDVWRFELPSTSSLPTTFGFSGPGALRQHFGRYTNDTQLYEVTYLYRKAALLHRLSLGGGSMTPPGFDVVNGHVRMHWDNFDGEVGPFLEGRVLSENDPLPGAKATTVSVRTHPALKGPDQQSQYWRQVAEHFRKKGWLDRMFNYLWDEPRPDQYAAMIQLGETVHRGDPAVKNLVTAPLRPEWSAFVDIWTPTINCFERPENHRGDYCGITVGRTEYNPELAKGKKLWWYQACGTHGCNIVGGLYFRGWPSLMIDHNGVRNRIMEWLTFKYGIQGELYFNTDEAFAKIPDSWKDVYLFGGNGDGTLFYPGRPDVIGGTKDIPVESIRLKLVREGLEDYEYLSMFSKLDPAKTTELLNNLIRRTYDFDNNPDTLYSARKTMGDAISRATK